jgi:prepilin-type processing-associated H-X9-DG protein
MRRITGTIGATLAVVAALATTATAQDREEARTSCATVTSIMGHSEEEWFDDYEEGNELDEDIFEDTSRLASAGWDWIVRILPFIEQENVSRSGGEVMTSFRSRHPGGANFSMEDGSVRFIRYDIARPTWLHAGDRQDGQVLGSD